MSGRSIHMALWVDVARFSDSYIEREVLPSLSHEGKPVTLGQLRVMCFDYRNRGYEVFPPCDNYDERGRCLGHEGSS